MSTRIEMPDLSSDGEGATLVNWLVSVGDRVEKGDVIAELETDKSMLELEAPATGTIAGFEVDEGVEDIRPGTLLALLEPEDAASADASGDGKTEATSGDGDEEAASDRTPASGGEPDPDAEPTQATDRRAASTRSATASTPTEPESTAPSHGHEDESRTLRTSTPLARRAAKERDIDLSTITGSGPGGRVVEEDVLRSAETDDSASGSRPSASAEASAEEKSVEDASSSYETRPLGAMRRTIARRVADSKRQVPHFYLRRRCSMDAVLEARLELNREMGEDGVKISVNDFVLCAAARALRDVPEANVSFIDTDPDSNAAPELRVFRRVDVCVAVATDGGLVTPVIRDADRKGLARLAEEVRELAALAREGRLRPEQYQGGSFTISNLGMYGVETVYPILNAPQACILGVGAVREEPVVRQGEVGIGQIAGFTLAADHRAVDGAVGARLLAALCERLEDPLSMLL